MGERPRYASRALSARVAAAYRDNICRDLHPANSIRSPSDPPARSQASANPCRSMCGCNPSIPIARPRRRTICCTAFGDIARPSFPESHNAGSAAYL